MEHLIEIMSKQFGLKDLIDILIVSYLIYRVLLIIRGTRAVQMLVGLAILLVFFWLGVSNKLYGLSWILSHFFESIFIIVVILFQDQIRSALAYVGGGRGVLNFFKKVVQGPEIEEIIEVCGVLGRERIGALIVIERRQGLMNYKETGTKLNANIHSDLIYAIFQSRSALHDGAIIISGGKIASAGCFLPLSKEVEIDRHLGTRHRAGIGITEDTDAVAITVSEETGRIHICYEGEFYFCETEQALRQKLRTILTYERAYVKTPTAPARQAGE